MIRKYVLPVFLATVLLVAACDAQGNPNPAQPGSVGVATNEAQQAFVCDGREVLVPINGQVFPFNVGGINDPNYYVVYDPSQSGAADLPPKGWWYQPCLPGPHRDAHEGAIILQAGTYRYVGPECTVWHNWDGNHPFDQGRILVNRQNVEFLRVPSTAGHGTEAWVFVRCQKSDASGFSFTLR